MGHIWVRERGFRLRAGTKCCVISPGAANSHFHVTPARGYDFYCNATNLCYVSHESRWLYTTGLFSS